jgi:hypothetical protein
MLLFFIIVAIVVVIVGGGVVAVVVIIVGGGRGVPELSSGRYPDFSEFWFRPGLIKKAWPEPELCYFQRDRISERFCV